MEKEYISADSFLRDSWRLAAKVRASGWRPDVLVALWRGGAGVGASVHEFLRASGWNVAHAPLKCASYTGIDNNAGEVVFEFCGELFDTLMEGTRVLVVDDVFDTGRTAEAVKARIEARGAEMRMATVYWKPGRNVTALKPDYFVNEVGDYWIVFPHELDGLTAAEVAVKDSLVAELLNKFQNQNKAGQLDDGQAV